MGLYLFSNMIIPLVVLSYTTILKLRREQQIGYGQWFIMVILIAISYLVTTFVHFHGIFLLIDLLFKVGVAVMPAFINGKVEAVICRLHLEIILENIRCAVINRFADFHWNIIEYGMSKLDHVEKRQFKNILSERLDDNYSAKNGSQRQTSAITASNKHYESKGTMCDIKPTPDTPVLPSKIQNFLTQRSLQKPIEPKSSVIMPMSVDKKEHFKVLSSTLGIQGKEYQGFQKIKHPPVIFESQKELYKEENRRSEVPIQRSYGGSSSYISYAQKTMSNTKQLTKEHKIENPYLASVSIRKSTHNLQEEFDESPRGNTFVHQTEPMSGSKNSYSRQDYSRKTPSNLHPVHDQKQSKYQRQSPPNRYENRISYHRTEQKEETAERILDHLDISASEYSQMFEDIDDFNEQNKTLECAVEAIVEIGHRGTAQLEIYNLELYSNNEVRIVSLYGREFQKHRLKYMTSLSNNYYQLHFSGGSGVEKRKVKFRGTAKQFMAYLRNK